MADKKHGLVVSHISEDGEASFTFTIGHRTIEEITLPGLTPAQRAEADKILQAYLTDLTLNILENIHAAFISPPILRGDACAIIQGAQYLTRKGLVDLYRSNPDHFLKMN